MIKYITIFFLFSLIIGSAQKEAMQHPPDNSLTELKKIVKNELNTPSITSVTIINKDSIGTYDYISSMFSISNIDSIEFVGVAEQYYKNPKHLRLNSLLILYYNSKQNAFQELDSLDSNWKSNFRATEGMFKAGGMAFELENQLCIYSINTCGPGYKNLLRIDSIVSSDVFQGSSFTRLHSGCGMGPFKRIEN